MKFFSFLAAIPRSFFSRALYREAGRSWRGYGALYLFGIIFVHLLVTYGAFEIGFDVDEIKRHQQKESKSLSTSLDNVSGYIADIAEQFPDLTIKDGKAHIESDSVYVLKDVQSGSQDPIILIDTTGNTQSLKGSGAVMLITDERVIVRDQNGDKEYYTFAKAPDMVINNDKILHWLRYLPIAVLPGDFLGLYLYIFTLSLIFGLLGGLFCQINKVEGMCYRDLVRISMVAATPGLMLEALSNAIGIEFFHHPELIYFLMHAAYVYHGVESNKTAPFSKPTT
ncbi:MAG: DUF1189 domain-containing protein [Proteobacteria bacterium]|nr:DUF1189 domain-containing protein [Pseudomonadota bacterium]